MNQDSEYLMIGVNSYGRDILGSIDKIMKRTGAERTSEGKMRVWKKDNQVLGTGFSIGSAELARIHRNMKAPVLSCLCTVHDSPFDDSTVVAQSSQGVHQELLTMHGRWVLGLRMMYLAVLISVLFLASLRLLIYSGMFPQYEPVFEYYSYSIVVLPLSFGLITLWYMYLGNKAVKLVESIAEPGENIALIVRFLQPQGIDLSAHLKKNNEDDSILDVSNRALVFSVEEAVSEHISFPRHSLYMLTFGKDLQETAMERIDKLGGLVLSVGRPYAKQRALFNIKITYFLIVGMFFVASSILSGMVWSWLLGHTSIQFIVVLLLSLLVFLVVIRLLRDRIWMWLEQRFFMN
ncbi:MAG: hypothetical protein RTU92_04420 [Candidatus Thorarchaeota archaeon]